MRHCWLYARRHHFIFNRRTPAHVWFRCWACGWSKCSLVLPRDTSRTTFVVGERVRVVSARQGWGSHGRLLRGEGTVTGFVKQTIAGTTSSRLFVVIALDSGKRVERDVYSEAWQLYEHMMEYRE